MDEQALAAMYGGMSEAALEGVIRSFALAAGWLYYHTHDSRRSDPGFPDCVLVRGNVVKYRELKTQKGMLSPEQVIWGRALVLAGQDWGIWRPYDWGNNVIMKELE